MNFQPVNISTTDVLIYNDRVKHLKNSIEYLDKIGKFQSHLQTCGNLNSIHVQTEINYQQSSGGKNYWKEPEFDKYLSQIVRNRFDELSKEAVALMQQDCKKALYKLKDVIPSIQRQLEQDNS